MNKRGQSRQHFSRVSVSSTREELPPPDSSSERIHGDEEFQSVSYSRGAAQGGGRGRSDRHYSREDVYAPRPDYVPRGHYAPRGHYTPRADYAPRGHYTSREHYAPRGHYTSHEHYAPRGHYTPRVDYASRAESAPRSDYAAPPPEESRPADVHKEEPHDEKLKKFEDEDQEYPVPVPQYSKWTDIKELNMTELEPLMAHVYKFGWAEPTLVQSQAVRPMILGHNLVCQTPPGSGKTGTFIIGSIGRNCLNPKTVGSVGIIVITSSHEVAQQIHEVFSSFISGDAERYPLNFESCLCIGGTLKKTSDNRAEINRLISQKKNVIMVGTMGRIKELIENRYVDVSKLKTLVVDEFDSMISHDRGSSPQLIDIMRQLPETTQTCLFSATMDQSTRDQLDEFLDRPVKVIMPSPLENITKLAIWATDSRVRMPPHELYRYRMEALKAVLRHIMCNCPELARIMIFTCSKDEAHFIADDINAEFGAGSALSHTSDIVDREGTATMFRNGGVKFLVSTPGTMGRGVDLIDVRLVILFNLSKISSANDCIHIAGRTGRHGKTGRALFILAPSDIEIVKSLSDMGVDIREATCIEELDF